MQVAGSCAGCARPEHCWPAGRFLLRCSCAAHCACDNFGGRFQDRSVFLITCYVTISDVSRAEGSLVDVRGRWAGPERWQAIFGWLPAKAALRCSQLQGGRCSNVDFRAADPSIASTSGVSCKGTRPLRVRWGGGASEGISSSWHTRHLVATGLEGDVVGSSCGWLLGVWREDRAL